MKRLHKLVVPNKPPVVLYLQRSDVQFHLPKLMNNSPTKAISPEKFENPSIHDFQGPVKPSFFASTYREYLTSYEKSEIHKYLQIYYVRQTTPTENNAPKKGIKFYPFQANEHIAYRYQQLQILGQGSFGSVIKCIDHKTHQNVAIKMIKDSKRTHKQMVLELDILKHLQLNGDNHHILHYIDVFQFRNFFCIVMELLGPSLHTVIQENGFKPLNPSTIKTVAAQLANAIQYMHESDIIHCDIKPDNVLFSPIRKTSLRVIDFGCSCWVGKTMYEYIQSRYYRAPEVILNLKYSTGIDVWSYGCVLFEIASGRPLFTPEDEEELFHMMIEALGSPPQSIINKAGKFCSFIKSDRKIQPYQNKRTGRLYFPLAMPFEKRISNMSESFIDVIKACLTWDHEVRPSMAEILQMPYFQE